MSEHMPAVKALLAFMDIVAAEYRDMETRASPRKKKVIACAREMARRASGQNFTGDLDPSDSVVMGIPGGEVCRDVKNTAALAYPFQPRWACYIAEAEAAVDIVEKL